MPDNAERLLKLATLAFPDLTLGEREVLRCAATGEWADLAKWGPPQPEGKKRKPGGGPLRSAVLQWMCADDPRAKRLVHRKGVRIKNATLDQPLDLECADVPFAFGLDSCVLPRLIAEHTKFEDTLYLKHCRIDGMLNLLGAYIGGQLLCDGTQVEGSRGVAIRADNATINNNVSLANNFLAESTVYFVGAKIEGQLNCKNSNFINEYGCVLIADNAYIGNDVLLSEGFYALGEVRMPGAKIKGQLNCTCGHFINNEGMALTLECATLTNGLLLEPKEIYGYIDLFRTQIRTNLRITLRSTATTTLDLRGTKVGELIDTRKSWPEAGKLLLDGFQYDDIHNESPRRAAERLDWLGRMPDGQFLPQPYEQLASWFQKTGHDSEAKDIRVAKEKARIKQWLSIWSRAYWRALWDKWHGRTEDIERGGKKMPNPAAKPWKLFFKEPWKRFWWHLKGLTIGYGYRPQRAIYGLGILIVLGCVLFTVGQKGMTKSICYNGNAIYADGSHAASTLVASDYPKFRPFVYSMDVALPIVDLQQERYWMPNYHHHGPDVPWWEEGWWLWGVNWLEILAGWGLATMGVAGVTGIIKKD